MVVVMMVTMMVAVMVMVAVAGCSLMILSIQFAIVHQLSVYPLLESPLYIYRERENF